MYPNKDDTIDILLDAARQAAFDSSADHPEDIGYAMSFAIESVSKSLLLAHKKFGEKREKNILNTVNYTASDYNSGRSPKSE